MKKFIMILPIMMLVGCDGGIDGYVTPKMYDIAAEQCSNHGGVRRTKGTSFTALTMKGYTIQVITTCMDKTYVEGPWIDNDKVMP